MGIVLGTIFHIVAVAIFISFPIYLLYCLLEEKQNIFHKIFDIPIKIKDKVKKGNKLYQCGSCNRYFRQYMIQLYVAKKGYRACPHCNKESSSIIFSNFEHIKVTDSWMDTHADCLKLNKKDYLKVWRTIRSLKEMRITKEEMDRFEEYNKIKLDLNWIKNLTE